jgi:hypothetical protein
MRPASVRALLWVLTRSDDWLFYRQHGQYPRGY